MTFGVPVTARRILVATSACLALLSGAPAPAQEAPPAGSGAAPPAGGEDNLTVYLLTMGPGDAIWERFGHNALWIHDSRTGEDLAYNWGMFDFASEDFISRFMMGRMRYWMEAFPMRPMVDAYVHANRSVWAQELALTPGQERALDEFVRWNAREENRFYTYDYYRDNCSTRVRDALDRVLDGRLRAATDTVATGTTFRWHTRRLTEEAQPLYTGIDIMLGQPVDRPISAWDEMFLPMRLRDRLRSFEVRDENGARRSMVVREMQLFQADREEEAARPADELPAYLAIGAVLALLLAGLAFAAARGSRRSRVAFATLGTLWSVLAGIAGTLMLLTWVFTDHEVTYANENLLQLSPLSLVLAVVLPLGLLRAREGDAAGTARRLALAIAGLAVLGFLLQVLTTFDQVNGQTIALALPAHLALAWGTRTISVRPRSARTPIATAPPSPGHRAPRSAASVRDGAAS